jgi:urease accessory protein
MIRLTQRLEGPVTPRAAVSLPYELRRRSRVKIRLDSGEEAGLFLPRGLVLRDGDCLGGDEGWIVRVRATPESVSRARTHDPLLLARASYHLGNRHVALQVGPDELRYLHDHVLDDLVRALGLTVTVEDLPFEPEAGAYGGHGHEHGDPHGTDPEHPQGQGHGPGHGHEH